MISIRTLILGLALVGLAGPVSWAGDSTRGWGVTGSHGTAGNALNSATLHKLEGEVAQIVTIGKDITSMHRSVTSCGTCTYYQNTGDNNSISNNSTTGSNSGAVTSTGNFGSD